MAVGNKSPIPVVGQQQSPRSPSSPRVPALKGTTGYKLVQNTATPARYVSINYLCISFDTLVCVCLCVGRIQKISSNILISWPQLDDFLAHIVSAVKTA